MVHKQLLDEYRVPTEEGRKQMRYMVSHWITTQMGEQRGGVTVEDDIQGTVTIPNAEIIDDIDQSFSILPSTSAAVAEEPSTDGGVLHWAERFMQFPVDGVQRMIEYTRCMTELQKQMAEKEKARAVAEEKAVDTERQRGENERLRAEAEKAHESRLEKELLLVREKRLIDTHPHPESKKKRTEVTVTEDGPLQHGRLYSISHTALRRLHEQRTRDAVPPLPRIFKVVHDWMVAKQLSYNLRFEAKDIGGIVVVYGNHRGPHRFRGTRYEDHLHRHITETLFPSDENAPNPFIVSGTAGPSEPVAVIFQNTESECPADWLGPSPEQQRADTERLCRMLEIPTEEWPNSVTDIASEPAVRMQRLWKRMCSREPSHRIGEWIQKVGTPSQSNRPNREWLYTFAVLVTRLDGWRNDIKQTGGYTKDVVPLVRRLLVVLRGMSDTHPLYHRLIGLTLRP